MQASFRRKGKGSGGVPEAIVTLGIVKKTEQEFAEWLATGKGLGNLLNQSRGYLDYGMIWTVAVVAVLVAVAFYQIVIMAERLTLARLGMRTAE